jgi:hypothetical protein
MRTDKQLLRIFETEPEWIFQYLFPDVLRQFERSHPGHPLAAAFKPLLVEEMILIGELPELEETQSGKDLIRIGEARGLVKAVLLHLSARHGKVPDEVEKQIRSLPAEQAERLLQFVLRCETLAEVTQWLRDV